MADREKVIQHFQDAIEASGNNNKWRFVRLDIIEDAIDLLKAQEPRVLTLNEVEDKLDDVVWIEEPGCENLSANFAVIAAYSRKYNKVYAYFFSTSKKEFEYGEYNKTWRCWSAKPSDAERKAVAWND